MLKRILCIALCALTLGNTYINAAANGNTTTSLPFPLQDFFDDSEDSDDSSVLFAIPLEESSLLESSEDDDRTNAIGIPIEDITQPIQLTDAPSDYEQRKQQFFDLAKKVQTLKAALAVELEKSRSPSHNEALLATDEFDIAAYNYQLEEIEVARKKLLNQAYQDINKRRSTPIHPRYIRDLDQQIKQTYEIIKQLPIDTL